MATVPPGAVVDVPPGHYDGPLSITQPMTLRGAGELTRIDGQGLQRPIHIKVLADEPVVLDSLRFNHGHNEDGGGLLISAGNVRLRNIHFHHCIARGRGGALAVRGGTVTAVQIYAVDCAAERGGAVWVGERGRLVVRDSQIARSQANYGGAIAVEDGVSVEVEGMTLRRTRAHSSTGGQAMHARGTARGRPVVRLTRVLIDDRSLGLPIVVDPTFPAEFRVEASDMPRSVQSTAGVVDDGANRWR